jgi:hypothetical protein
MLIAVFLPRVEEPTTFGGIAENTLIQSGEGWVFVGLALGIAAAAYRAILGRSSGWAIVVLAAIAVVIAVYLGTNSDSLTLYPIDGNGNADQSGEGVKATPSIGIYAAGLGGLLAVWGGYQIARGRSTGIAWRATPPGE